MKPQDKTTRSDVQRTASGLYKSEIAHPLIVGRRLTLTAATRHELDEDRITIAGWQREYRRSRMPLEEFRNKLARFENPRAVAMRLRVAWDEHTARAPSSMRSKLRAIWLHQLAPKLGELYVIELKGRRLAAWDAWCIEATYAPKSQWDAWTQLVKCVRAALVDGDDVPWRLGGGKYWRPSRRPVRLRRPAAATSLEEARRLIAMALEVDNDERARGRYADLAFRCVLALRCALRNGEIAGLAWDDCAIDADKPRILVQRQAIDQWRTHDEAGIAAGRPMKLPKGNKMREVTLDPESLLTLVAQRDQLRVMGWFDPKGPVFPGQTKPWLGAWRNNANGIDPREFRRVAVRAKMPFEQLWVPHSLRHSTATLEALSGANLRAIQKRTGQSTLRVLEDYIHERLGTGESSIGRLLGEEGADP
jgi:integrase